MTYLHLAFKNANFVYKDEKGSVGKEESIKFSSENGPIKIHNIENVLRVLCGLRPKKFNKESLYNNDNEFEDLIHECATNSYISYENVFDFYNAEKTINVKDESGKKIEKLALLPHYREFIHGGVYRYNANTKLTSKLFNIAVNGFYSWKRIEMVFEKEKELYNELINFFNKTLGVDVLKEYCNDFNAFSVELREHWDNKEYKEFVSEKFPVYVEKRLAFSAGLKAILGLNEKLNEDLEKLKDETDSKKLKSSHGDGNLSGTSKIPVMLRQYADSRKLSFDGEIIIKIKDDYILERMSNFGVNPTILDGGLVEVVGKYDMIDEVLLSEQYKKINE